MSWTFDFELKGGDVTKHQLPGYVAYITLKNHTRSDGEIHISHQCMGPSELEAEVNRLKGELDEILRRGKAGMQRYESETRKAIEAKRS